MKLAPLVTIMVLAAAMSGCLTDRSAPVAAETDGVEEGAVLPTVTARIEGTIMTSNPTSPLGRCEPNPDACQEHRWTLPQESADGIAQQASRITITLDLGSPPQGDLDLYVYDAAGNLLGSSTRINPMTGAGEEVILGSTEPQTLTFEVHNYAGVATAYVIEVQAEMVASAQAAVGGPVTITKQGDRYVATRTIIFEEEVTATAGDAWATTGAGFIAFDGEGSDYRLEAELRGKGDTEEEARANLDEMRLEHSLTQAGRLELDVHARPGGDWEDKEAHLRFSVPAHLDWGRVHLETIAGFVSASNLEVLDLHAETTAGHISIDSVAAANMILSTSAGAVTADMDAPLASGAWRIDATAGAIDLDVVETAAVGYDVDARTSAGSVSFHFDDAPTTSSDCQYASCHRHATTNGYGSRDIQVVVDLDTTAGGITAGS